MSKIVEGLEILKFLEIERESLQKTMHRVLENGDIGTYKNLIQAYERVLGLIRDTEKENKWENLYSKYNTESIPMISIWKQKNDDVKDIKQFRLYDDNLLNLVIKLVNQIQMSEFKDENGHRIKNNTYYCDLLSYLIKDNIKSNTLKFDNNKPKYRKGQKALQFSENGITLEENRIVSVVESDECKSTMVIDKDSIECSIEDKPTCYLYDKKDQKAKIEDCLLLTYFNNESIEYELILTPEKSISSYIKHFDSYDKLLTAINEYHNKINLNMIRVDCKTIGMDTYHRLEKEKLDILIRQMECDSIDTLIK